MFPISCIPHYSRSRIKLVGNDENGGTDEVGKNTVFYQGFYSVLSGSLTAIKIKTDNSGNVKVALYSNAASNPGTVLTSSGSTAVVPGWNTIPVTPYVVQSTFYWLAFNSDTQMVLNLTTTGMTDYYKSATYSTFTFVSNPTGLTSFTTANFQLGGWT